MDYEKDLEIDKYLLDEIVETQATHFNRWAAAAAEALTRLKRAKEILSIRKTEAKDELDRVKAKVDLECRRSPKAFELEKVPSDKLAESVINADPRYQKALKDFRGVIEKYTMELLDAESEYEMLNVAKESFSERRSMIECDVKLYCAGFWAKPKQPKEMKKERIDNINEQRRETISRTIARRRQGNE